MGNTQPKPIIPPSTIPPTIPKPIPPDLLYGDKIHIGDTIYRIVIFPPNLNIDYNFTFNDFIKLGGKMTGIWKVIHIDNFQHTIVFSQHSNISNPSYLDLNAIAYKIDIDIEEHKRNLFCLYKLYPVDLEDYKKHNINLETIQAFMNWSISVCNHDKYNSSQGCISMISYIFWRLLKAEKGFTSNDLEKIARAIVLISAKLVDDFEHDDEVSKKSEKYIIKTLNFSFNLPTVHRHLGLLIDYYNIQDEKALNFMDYLENITYIYSLFPKYSPSIISEVIFCMVNSNITITDPVQFDECQKELIFIFNDSKQNKRCIEARKRYKFNYKNELSLIPIETLKQSFSDYKCSDKYEGYKKGEIVQKNKLGSGSYGVIYEIEDTSDLSRKMVKKDMVIEDYIYGFHINEISIPISLNHPNIISVFDPSITLEKISFYMKKLTPLKKLNLPLSIHELKLYGKQLLTGLEYLHSNNIIHGDLNPNNILVDEDEKLFKIIDFGLSFIVSTNKPQKYNIHVFTQGFKPPEILRGLKYNNKADVWAMGCVLFHLATKKYIFMGDNIIDDQLLIFSKGNVKNLFSQDKAEVLYDNPKYKPELFKSILKVDWDNNGINEFCDLLSNLLAMNPNYRYSARQALEHPFFIF